MAIFEETFDVLDARIAFLTAIVPKTKNAKGQHTECSQCGNPFSNHIQAAFSGKPSIGG